VGALHRLAQVAKLASCHVETGHVDDDIAADRYGPQRLSDHRRVGPHAEPLLAAPHHRDSPAVGVTHRREIGDQFLELPLIADRVAADHRITHPRPVGQRRRLGRVEVVGLTGLHDERRQRIRGGGIDQSPRPRQVVWSRTRRCRPHQHQPRAGDQDVTEQIERQHVRGQPRQQTDGSRCGMRRRDRTT